MRQFAKFAKTPLYRGYIQNHHQLRPSFLTFFKKFSSYTTDYQKKYLKALHPCRTFFKKTTSLYWWLSQKHPEKVTPCFNFFSKNLHLLPGLFPKRYLLVLPLSEKIRKKHHSTPLIIKITPLFCNTLFELFSKNFYPSTVDYHFFSAFCIISNATFLKNPPLTVTIAFFLPFVSASLKKLKIFFLHTGDYRKNTPFCITLFCTFF